MVGDQRRIFIDSAQLHSAYMEASVWIFSNRNPGLRICRKNVEWGPTEA
jgi:hypothetical protein